MISLVATGVSEALQAKLGRVPAPHEQAAIVDVVASTVLDQSTPAQAMAFAFAMGFGSTCVFSDSRGDHPDYAALGAALRTPEVVAVLHEAQRGQ